MPYHSPITKRNPEPSNKQLVMILLLFLGFFLTIVITVFALVNRLVYMIPVSFEQTLGKAIVTQLNYQNDNVLISKKLNDLVDSLEEKLTDDVNADRDYNVIYEDEEIVNAVAIPGDTIVIYKGLLEKVDSENELAMILGHEIGHFANRDHLKGLSNILLIRLIFSFFIDPNSLLNVGVDVTNTIVNAQYSQSQELAADKFGLDLLNKRYGHVGGATDFFTKLQELEKEANRDDSIAFLASHPLAKKRIKTLKKLIRKQKYSSQEKILLDWIL